jgi:hypothetical protein
VIVNGTLELRSQLTLKQLDIINKKRFDILPPPIFSRQDHGWKRFLFGILKENQAPQHMIKVNVRRLKAPLEEVTYL